MQTARGAAAHPIKRKACTRRDWLFQTAASFVAASAGMKAQAPAQPGTRRRPNVLLILTDDQGYGDMSSHGNPDLQTPHLDRLAAESAEFTRFYVSPVCAPTRASLLTGRYNIKTGVHGVTGGKETMATDETTIAEAFRGAGYRTALVGKWHLGETYPHVPHAQGFETFIGMRNGHWLEYFDSEIEKNGKPYIAKGYIADALTNEAIEWFRTHRDEPVFLYLAYNTPHTPYQVPYRYWKPFTERGMDVGLAAIYGMVANIDDNVGRLLGELDTLGIAGDTIVIFMSDNGPIGTRFNAGLRGSKGSVYEGGVRTPFLLRWPGRVPAGRKVETIAAHIDVYPTLADLCAVDRPSALPIDGVSLRPLLNPVTPAAVTAAEAAWPHRDLFTHREREGNEATIYPGAIRTQRYNLVNGTELYDIQQDPGESKDIAAAHPDLVREMRQRYETWFNESIAARGFHSTPLPVGYAEENPVYLPAARASFQGKLRFHGRFGYSHDWITGWTEASDFVYWDIDAVTAGTYALTLHYLCPRDCVGTELVASAAGASCRKVISQATDMEPLPDRNLVLLERNVIMPWAKMSLGQLMLPKGTTRLELRCLSKPGPRVADLRGLSLERL
ncbi:MAG: arylsulfatase [Bryobacterales bacterium]|nr:arylsulfatase [Bryobacterales bacterium]